MERNILLSLPRCLPRALNVKNPACAASTPRFASPTLRRTSSVRPQPAAYRCLHATSVPKYASKPPPSRSSRGPQPDEESRTDISSLDVLRGAPAPATSIDACTSDGFALNNQMRIGGCGVLLLGGEAFRWRPWLTGNRKEGTVGGGGGGLGDDAMTGKLKNAKGQWEVQDEAWGLLELLYPKPDLLIIGTGPHMMPLSPSVRKYLNGLGIRLEIQDTRNAAAQFNLLATERGVSQVGAALIPIGWKEGR